MADEEAEILEAEEERKAVLEKAKEVPDPVTLALMEIIRKQEAIDNGLTAINTRLDAAEKRHEAHPETAAAPPVPVEIENPEPDPDPGEPDPDPGPAKPAGRKRRVRLGRNRAART